MKLSTLSLALLAFGTSFASVARDRLSGSYEPAQELYAESNPVFFTYWKAKAGESVAIKQSHVVSGKQACAVMDGLKADGARRKGATSTTTVPFQI